MNKKLREEVLKKIKPNKTEQEILENIVQRFITRIRRASKRLKYNCDFFIGGSFGKNTYLKTSSDVDLFCRFSQEYEDDKLSEYLSNILTEAKFDFKKQKGSRDYFSLSFRSKGIKLIFEIIPNRIINSLEEAVNTTDISPLHISFLNTKAKENKNLCDEIRLTKQYFKANNLYGAESYINGFSGHSIDILISYFGSLSNLIMDAKSWDEETFIDVNNFYSNKTQALELIDKSKISNLILIDPIAKTRNAARALSEEKYCEFLILANNFVEFKKEDFEIKIPDSNEVSFQAKKFAKENNLKTLIYNLKFKITNESEDIVGSKLLKISKKLKAYFESFGFDIFLDDFHIDMKKGICLMIYLFEKKDLPTVKIAIGPKAHMKDAVTNFLRNKSYSFIKNGRVCVFEDKPEYKLKDVSNLDLVDFQKVLTKDISFVSSVRRSLK